MNLDIPKILAISIAVMSLGGCERVMYTPSCTSSAPYDYGMRFSTLRNGVITDNETGLSWYRCPFGTNYNGLNACIGTPLFVSAENAFLSVDETAEKSAVQWRLPTIDEFKTILREDCENPALDPMVFPGSLVENHWTSDNRDQESGFSCAIYTYQGASSCRLDKENLFPFMIVTDQKLN